MSEIRYQVFVSSTYEDLKEERKQVTQAILEAHCIPCGMELFPASGKSQWEFIKNVINGSDVYLVIIAGKYGSTPKNRKTSYTEMEFKYAKSINKPIIALIHSNIEDLPARKVERTKEARESLQRFIEKAKTGRLVKFWQNQYDIKTAVVNALNEQKSDLKDCGWIRYSDTSPINDDHTSQELSFRNEKLTGQLNELTNINSDLVKQLENKTEANKLLSKEKTNLEKVLKYELDEVKKKNSDLVKELASNKATLKKIKKDNSDLQQKIANNDPEELNKKLIEARKECAHLTSELEAKTNAISKMQNEIARLRDNSHSNSLSLENKQQELRKNKFIDPKSIPGNTENTKSFWVYFVNYIITRNDIYSDRNFLSVLNCNKSFARDTRFEVFFKVFSSYKDWISINRQAITKVYQYTCSTESKQESYFNMPNIDYYTEVFDSQNYNREALNNKISSFFTNYFFIIKYINNPYSRVRSEAITCKEKMDEDCDTLLSYVYAAYMNGII